MNSLDSSDNTEFDASQKPLPEDQPTPLLVEQPSGYVPMASKYVEASKAHRAKNNPEFGVKYAMYTANKNLFDQYQSENSSPVIENLSQHYLGGELPGYTPLHHQTETNIAIPISEAEPVTQQETISSTPSKETNQENIHGTQQPTDTHKVSEDTHTHSLSPTKPVSDAPLASEDKTNLDSDP